MNVLYVGWQNPETRRWYTIGCLVKRNERYQFNYTKGALDASKASPSSFQYLERMKDPDKTYYSDKLFPLFANRLLNKSRPEYPEYLTWMSVDEDTGELELLARSGGRRATDQFCIYPKVEPNEKGEIVLYFFSHGIRYLKNTEQEKIEHLKPGDTLQLTPENNDHDSYALSLETESSVRIGYCPRYLNQGLRRISGQSLISLVVEKVNPDAPLQFRLLCKAVFASREGFDLYAADEHELLGT
uniref:HIRAN domain-containing protein n=1 Tax=Candidatus Kentrum sp. FW TaxID=2126338 RepID=A0A450TS91_9GAMM|nr:MAG: HIRAN domain-containing protein [Candidatus Kentron sp. FW]